MNIIILIALYFVLGALFTIILRQGYVSVENSRSEAWLAMLTIVSWPAWLVIFLTFED